MVKTRRSLNTIKGAAIDVRALREPKFAATTLAVFLVEFAVFIPITYISDYALEFGMQPDRAYMLIVILNAAAIPGRALPGYFADRMGRFNVMIITAFICAILTFAVWLTVHNEAAIYAYVVLFGFWSGAAISLTPVCIGQVCCTKDYGKRSGTVFTISSFGTLVGIPIAGSILGTEGKHFSGLILFSGSLYTAASFAFIWARVLSGGWKANVVV